MFHKCTKRKRFPNGTELVLRTEHKNAFTTIGLTKCHRAINCRYQAFT